MRWWFENRQTGAMTVAQFPNWPLAALGIAWLIGRITADGSRINDLAGIATTGLWLYWGADELLRGVNPWRRLLGSIVILWQLGSLVF